jgi:hypothetical protein
MTYYVIQLDNFSKDIRYDSTDFGPIKDINLATWYKTIEDAELMIQSIKDEYIGEQLKIRKLNITLEDI